MAANISSPVPANVASTLASLASSHGLGERLGGVALPDDHRQLVRLRQSRVAANRRPERRRQAERGEELAQVATADLARAVRRPSPSPAPCSIRCSMRSSPSDSSRCSSHARARRAARRRVAIEFRLHSGPAHRPVRYGVARTVTVVTDRVKTAVVISVAASAARRIGRVRQVGPPARLWEISSPV